MPNTRRTLIRAAIALTALLVACDQDDSGPLGLELGGVQADQPALAGATRTLLKSSWAAAEFFSLAGCISSSVNVVIADETRHETRAGPPTSGPFLFASILQYDLCAEEYVSDIIVNAEQGVSFTVSRGLSTATLQATTTAVDFIGGEEVQVAFDLSWTSFGDRFTSTEKTISKPGGLTLSFRGTGYDATATGTVSLNGVSLTPEAATFGQIVKSRYLTLSLEGA
jgi:hypothetical protein